MIYSGKFNKGTSAPLKSDEALDLITLFAFIVPLMVGTVSEEGWVFIYQASSKPISEAEYILATAYLFGIDMVSVCNPYPCVHAPVSNLLDEGASAISSPVLLG